MIGEPYSGKPNVRFDEGELEIEPSRSLRQLSTLLKPRLQHYLLHGSGKCVIRDKLLFLRGHASLINFTEETIKRHFLVGHW